MSKNQLLELYEELDDTNVEGAQPLNKRLFQKRESKKQETDARLFVRAQEISREFQFTYKAARFEEAWLLDSLVEIAEHKWISDVLRKVKGGKEASVYLCRSGVAVDAPLVAAKVYRPRMLRNLKNDQQYRVGRVDLGEDGNALVKSADVHAIQKRSNYGEGLRHQSWIAYEFTTLETLYEAGVDVPKPYAMEKNAILMGFVGDLDNSAPALNTIDLDLDEANRLYDRVIHNIDLMLTHNCIHGDLSAYNILYWNGDITLIDFPQVVLPESNPASWNIFFRDVTRVCQYFSAQGVQCDARKLAADLWTSHGHKIVKEVDPKYLDAEKPEDRRLWNKQK
ncbi:MAG: RIO1 family regulatory kinase/ATPase [Anaerolineales bacterium]|nr:RIO1 family regulatory kinase/ATPase [Anaerolineales bacterium]